MAFTATAALLILGAGVATYGAVRLATRLMRGARRGVPGAPSLGWALLFLTSGRMPPPPPATQIEQELNSERDRLVAGQRDQDS